MPADHHREISREAITRVQGPRRLAGWLAASQGVNVPRVKRGDDDDDVGVSDEEKNEGDIAGREGQIERERGRKERERESVSQRVSE